MKLKYLRASLLMVIFCNYSINSMEKIDIDSYTYLSDRRVINLFDAVIYDYMISQENHLSLSLNDFDEVLKIYAKYLENNFALPHICPRFNEIFKTCLERMPEIGLTYLKNKIKSKINKIKSKKVFIQEIFDKKPLAKILNDINWDNIEIENIKAVFNLIDINEKDDNDWTILMHASFYGYIDIVEMLFDIGANLNQRSKSGDTALQLAISQGHKNVIDFLVNKNVQ